MRLLLALATVFVCVLPTSARAADPRLTARLDPETAAQVQQLVDTAHAQGLPTEPLISKALEGAAKRAPAERIVSAVRAQSVALGEARAALGDSSSAPEIVAGAGALLAGVPRDSLVRLRATRPGQPLVVPLVVLADLVTRKVPTEAAASAVLTASRAGARDTDLLRMRERVERDIAAGVPPASAAMLRARGLTPTGGALPTGKRPASRATGASPP
jgi:hypothetical protein